MDELAPRLESFI